MNELLIFWLSTGVFFFIIEMFTATLYGLSISIAAFVAAFYVWFTGEPNLSVIQAVIFAVVSAFFSYFLPKWIQPKGTVARSDNPIDQKIGDIFALKTASG